MADKYHSDTQEKIESVSYQPGLQDSGDLEAGTKTVTATAEATGVANADYSAALTLLQPSDTRITVHRIAARLALTIDSMTAGQLNCRVYVDNQDAQRRLFDISWTTTGAKLTAVDTHSGNLATIFSLLKDGVAHVFYFFFWVNTGNAVISLCQLWEAVGSCLTIAACFYAYPLVVRHIGFMGGYFFLKVLGTGASKGRWGIDSSAHYIQELTGGQENLLPTSVVHDSYFSMGSAVATDITYIDQTVLILRSEQ